MARVAGVAAGAIFFLLTRRLAGPADATVVYQIGVGTFIACFVVLLMGRRIERTLEVLNWILVVCILGSFLILAMIFVPGSTWLAAAAGLIGFDMADQAFKFAPEGVDFFLLAALIAYSGAGGAVNITLSNWARDKGYGMGSRVRVYPWRRSADTKYTLLTPALSSSPTIDDAALERLVADRPGRPMGRLLHRSNSRNGASRSAVRDIFTTGLRHSGPRDKRCPCQ